MRLRRGVSFVAWCPPSAGTLGLKRIRFQGENEGSAFVLVREPACRAQASEGRLDVTSGTDFALAGEGVWVSAGYFLLRVKLNPVSAGCALPSERSSRPRLCRPGGGSAGSPWATSVQKGPVPRAPAVSLCRRGRWPRGGLGLARSGGGGGSGAEQRPGHAPPSLLPPPGRRGWWRVPRRVGLG